jgi:L-lactate dehydrogenase complex protein LldG
MSEREKILGRIREALTVSAPSPGQHHAGASHAPSEAEAATHIREWLPAVGDSFEEHVALFAKNSADLKSDFHLLDSQEELIAEITKIARNWKKIASHRDPLTDLVCRTLNLPVCLTDDGYDKSELEACDAGITSCDALIAQTGSVLVTSRSAGGRALSALPPHHVVLARRDQLLPDLGAAFELLAQRYSMDYPSFISLITGPSRTGDIERILVLGAHGPKQLTILCY